MPGEDCYQHYEVLKRADGSLWELGRGAMGVTYKAYDTNLRCTVALKVINPTYLQNQTARQRFLCEARAAAALRHRNVASVFHLGTDRDTYFYAMEFIDGQTVDEYLKHKGRLTPIEALNIAFQVARALSAAARRHLVHRDLKPANLMLVDEDGEKVVKVIDFGLAKRVEHKREKEEERSAALTVGGGFLGTPHFASPEQLENRDLDVRSDIYALGATLYYLVSGRPPFSGPVAQIMSQHLYRPVPREPLQGLPGPFVTLILWLLEKDRDKRPQSAAELRRAIHRCIQGLDATELSAPASGMIQALQPDAMETAVLPAPSETAVEVGSVFSGRYQVDQPLPDHVAGKRYRGVDLERGFPVSLLVLSREFLAGAPRLSALEAAVDRVRRAPHPGLRQVIAVETAGGQIVLVEEYLSAPPTLREVLRGRGRLTAAEVVAVLEQLALAADHARLQDLEYVDLTLGGIAGGWGEGRDAAGLESWMQRPLTEWPGLSLRVAPVERLFQARDSVHWAGEATVVQPSVSLSGIKGSYVRQLSLLAYELLGGPRRMLEAHGRYIPVVALPEAGNRVLRSGLAGELGTASDLARALAGSLTGHFVPDSGRSNRIPAGHDRFAAGQGPGALQGPDEPAGADVPPLVTLKDPALPAPAADPSSTRKARVRPAWRSGPALVLVACAGIIAGYLLLYRSRLPRPPARQQEARLNSATPLTIVLTPQPDPVERLRNELRKLPRGSPEHVRAYVRLVQALTRPGTPEPGEYNELGQVIEELRTKVPPISRDEFSRSYQSSIQDAASLNVLPAILWLAENETGPRAFDLFLRAARLGDSYAMMKVGRFYFTKGTPEDDAQGFEWLNRAYTASKPNLEAGAYIADCYLSGRGATRDVQKAEKIIFPLANQGVVPAMVLAGRILQSKAEDRQAEAACSAGSLKQKLMAQADALYNQARPWWERAAGKGDWNAAAHLGQLYEKGCGGVEKSEEKAEELYNEGITHDNALCMCFYGLMISGKPGRRSEAVGWIKRAAIAGIPSAREWLSTHAANPSGVTFQDGRQ